MDGYTGKCCGKVVERPQERGRRNRGIRHGSGYNGRRGYGNGGLMGKSVPERKGTLNITVVWGRASYLYAAVGTESRYAHSSEHPGKIADQKKSRRAAAGRSDHGQA